MKLFEYQGKEIFREYGITTPKGFIIDKKMKSKISGCHSVGHEGAGSGRRAGKAGGVKFAHDIEEAEKIFDEFMGMEIRREGKKVLVEKNGRQGKLSQHFSRQEQKEISDDVFSGRRNQHRVNGGENKEDIHRSPVRASGLPSPQAGQGSERCGKKNV